MQNMNIAATITSETSVTTKKLTGRDNQKCLKIQVAKS
jgi:hypothetical protein